MRVATNSWQAREALANRRPFNTYGAMRAVEGAYSLPWGTRLPDEWRAAYEASQRAGRITYTVLSYATPIAWVLDDGTVVQPPVKYSVTTSKHQGMLYALDRPQDTAIADAAQRERQTARDRRAQARERAFRPLPGMSAERTAELARTAPTFYADAARAAGITPAPEPEPADLMDRIGQVLDPRHDPEFPYNREAERRVLVDVDRYESTRARQYNVYIGERDDFAPDVVQYLDDGPTLPVSEREVPYESGEGAIYTPEYLARTEPSTTGTEPHLWRQLAA